MTTRTIVLALHITGVAAWLGANFVQLVLEPSVREGPADIAVAWTRQTIFLGERYYIAAGALIGVTGVILVLDNDWSWSAGFVWVGIAVVVIGGILGGAVFGRSPTVGSRRSSLAMAAPPPRCRPASSGSRCSTPRWSSRRCSRWCTSGRPDGLTLGLT